MKKIIQKIRKLFNISQKFTPSNNYYDTEVVVDGNRYRIGFDSVYLSLQNNRTTGWVLWNNFPPNPTLLGGEFENKEFKIYKIERKTHPSL